MLSYEHALKEGFSTPIDTLSPSPSTTSSDEITGGMTTGSQYGDTDLLVEILTKQQIRSRVEMKRIYECVCSYIKASITAFEEISDGENDSSGYSVVTQFKVPIDLFDQLRSELPFHLDGFKIIIDIENGQLGIRTVPGLCHEAQCGAW
jgi:hypothetical protein